jgi:hypothetical protein
MKSPIVLWNMIADDYAIRCCTDATMDKNNVHCRFKHEGFSFLTITLPNYGKDFQKGLDQGLVDRSLFQGFSWRAGLPRFLGGFLDLVFDRGSGVLLDTPDIDAILAVRQLTLLYSKILLPCSDAREKNAMSSYVQCEKEVRENDRRLLPADLADFERMSSLLFSSVFSKMDRKIYDGDVRPKHGPGATADRFRGNGKYLHRTWTDRLEKIFPAGEFLFPSWSYYDEGNGTNHLEPGAEIPVKVISVPKTLKTPRIIAVEPTAMQYAQQGVLEVILESLERSDSLSKLIGFDDQEPNQLLASIGSSDGSLSTLDLSEASDRVSNQLVRAMLRNHPHLHAAVDATRSRKADVPGHGVIRLAKFASMGSALCFPFEAMVFLTLIFLGIEKEQSTHFTKTDINRYLGRVRVYGDDLIVPTDTVHSVVHTLELFGAKVNVAKSFWIGRFRESCGKEYYNGHDVSIVKCRRVFPTHQKHAPEVISLVSLRNQLYLAGCWGTVRWLDSYIRKILKYFPVVLESSPVLGRTSFLGYETQRINEHLHAPRVKGFVVSSVLPRDPLDGPGALLKFFLKRGGLPSVDRNHLERAGRPRAVNIKPRWASPF